MANIISSYTGEPCIDVLSFPLPEKKNVEVNWWMNTNHFTDSQKIMRNIAQRKIYYWIIPIIYRPGSESAKRLALASCKRTYELK